MRWQQGRETVTGMISRGELERVSATASTPTFCSHRPTDNLGRSPRGASPCRKTHIMDVGLTL